MNIINPSAYVQKAKIKSENNFQDVFLLQQQEEDFLKRTPNYLHKDGKIYASISSDGKHYYAITVSPYHENFKSQIEKNIFPLVDCLIRKKYLTVSSCEGHDYLDYAYVRIMFGSKNSAEKFIEKFGYLKNVELNLLETSANVRQIKNGNQIKYETLYENCRDYSDENEKQIILKDEAKNMSRLFFRNYEKVWYVDLNIMKPEKGFKFFINWFFIRKKIKKLRIEKINEVILKIEKMDDYNL